MNRETVQYCDRCGAELVGAPEVRDGLRYCCEACARNEECDCGLPPDEDRRGGPAAAESEAG
jgi:hypothetical protein